MSFSIRKIGMLEMLKIAMLSTLIIYAQGPTVNLVLYISVTIRFPELKREPELHRLKKCIRMIAVKDLVCPHNCDKVFSLRQIDDIVGISRKHVHSLDLIPAHLKLNHFISSDFPLLDQTMAGNYNEKLPLRIVPVLPLCDARLRNINAELAMVCSLKQLRKTTPVIAVHLEIESDLLLGEIAQIHAVQLLLK